MAVTWCVAYTQPCKESWAKQNLLDQGYQVYLPRFQKICRHARKTEIKLSPLFPRYLFIAIDLNVAKWRSINSTGGVSYLLMASDHEPSVISSEILDDLKSKEIDFEVVPIAGLLAFTKGQKVQIVDGILKDLTAVFEKLTDHDRVQLLLDFMGKEVQVLLPGNVIQVL